MKSECLLHPKQAEAYEIRADFADPKDLGGSNVVGCVAIPVVSPTLYRAEYSEHESENVRFREFLVTKRTKRGVWASEPWGDKKFILNHSRKRLAYPTKAEAVESMRHRKRKYIRILEGKLEEAVAALSAAEAYRG